MMGCSGTAALLLSIAATTPNNIVHAHTNFCGTTWGDASTNCVDQQPCPLGTDEECNSGVCWADTACDTALGHGILYDLGHPQHSRFCGGSWDDANNNCKLSRHCPGGDSSECPGGEECYSFLSDCNYVEMIGGPLAGSTSGGSDGGGGDNNGRLPSNDPSRNNYCGSDWNNALLNCNEDDHWCPNGADEDCPGGKVCFAGTECKYVSDLFPTTSPTDEPTMQPTPSPPPTPSPVVYNTVENTRFCGEGWEDARTTCRIGSHCPSGNNGDCGGSQVCFGWITGCNIVDFEEYLKEEGQEIFGADHWLLPREEGATNANPAPNNEPQLPPAEIQIPPAFVSTNNEPQLPPAGIQIPPSAPKQPTQLPTTAPPIVYDPNVYRAENHVFCGTSWTDASDRCSSETFCSNGATHRCESASEFCWVGVSACNGADWVPTASPSTREVTEMPSRSPMVLPTRDPIISRTTANPTSQITPPPQAAVEEEATTSTTTIRQSYCATDYNQLLENCSIRSTCNRYKSCPDGYMCFSNFKCTTVTVSKPAPAIVQITSPPTPAPITSAPISNAPISKAPITYPPTQHPTIFTLSDEEVAQRLTNMNNYCASSLSQVLSTCSHSLYLCNDRDTMCGVGTFCFENMVCPDAAVTKAPVTAEPITPSPTPKQVSSLNGNSESSEGISAVAQNYCAQSVDLLPSMCSMAPTCNDDDGSCPLGMFCFGNHVCNNSSVMETAAAITSAPTRKPTSNPASKPISSQLNNPSSGNENTAVAIPQNYCAKSEDELHSTCATAQTCNDEEGPCPPGSFCFGNYSCSNQSAATASSPVTATLTTMKPTSRPISIALNKPAGGHGNTADANNQGSVKQNYCAQSTEQLEETCAWAPTCNDGDGPCPADTFCFPNVMCESRTQQAAESTQKDDSGKQPRPPTSMPTPDGKILDDVAAATTTSSDPVCNDLCLQPIDFADCDYVLSTGMDILPCTSVNGLVEIGNLCTGTGRCGTDLELNNCHPNNDQDIYLRLESSKCVEYGLVGGSGVIHSARTNEGEGNTDNNEGEPDDIDHLNDSFNMPNTTIGFEDNETAAREASTNSSSPSGNNQEDDLWGDGSFPDNGSDNENSDLTGWWLKEYNSATTGSTVVGWKKYPTVSAFVLVTAFSLLLW